MADNTGFKPKKAKIDHTADAPRELRITDLVRSHSKEIRALTTLVTAGNNVHRPNVQLNQMVPFYKRRRASSHNINRLPRKIREAMLKKDIVIPPKSKKSSRHHRRRPKNLLKEFTRRQRRIRWLETHIWHAKRFHMIEKWGHKIPNCPTDKCERSSYRAGTVNCLIQDQSYIQCIEVVAPDKQMVSCLETIVPAGQLKGESVGAYCGGSEVMACTLYHANQYPSGAICPAEIMFNSHFQQPGYHQMWVWCHTVALLNVWSLLCNTFSVVVDGRDEQVEEKTEFDTVKSQDGSVTIACLRDSLIRFRLNGQKTKETLARVIAPIVPSPDAAGPHVWWKDEFAVVDGEIKDMDSLSNWCRSNGKIASLRAKDPRLRMSAIQALMQEKAKQKPKNAKSEKLNKKKNFKNSKTDLVKVDNHENSEADAVSMGKGNHDIEVLAPIGAEVPRSALWSEKVRDIVSHNLMSQHEINERKSALLVPGTELSLGDEESCVPILLLLNNNMTDVILPANWGMPFWLAFAHAGARPGGVREGKMIDFETSRLHFPEDYPDTGACAQEELLEAHTLTTQHSKYPPAKRPNFDKLCTNSPFWFDWTMLLNGKAPVVMRDVAVLEALQKSCAIELTNQLSAVSVPVSLSAVNLVPVSIGMLNRGVPEGRSEICLPTAFDIAECSEGHSRTGPTLQAYSGKPKARDATYTTLADDRLSPSRQVIGFVKMGRYCPAVGSARGVGFVTMLSLQACLERNDLRVAKEGCNSSGILCLIRATDSVQYRYALLNVSGLK